MQKAKVLGDEHNKLMEKMKARAGGFVPSCTSTSKMNFNFGGGTITNTGTSTPSKNVPFKFSAAPALVSESKKKSERAQVNLFTIILNNQCIVKCIVCRLLTF